MDRPTDERLCRGLLASFAWHGDLYPTTLFSQGCKLKTLNPKPVWKRTCSNLGKEDQELIDPPGCYP